MSAEQDLRDLMRALYGNPDLGQEGDIPRLKRIAAEHRKNLLQLRYLFIAAVCLGIANGAGQILGGGGWPT